MRVQFLDGQREKAIACLKTRVLDVSRAFSSTSRGKRALGRKTHIFSPIQPDCLFLVQQSEKGTFKLKTRVLDALGLQKGPLLSDSGRCLGSLAMSFSPCLSRKRLFQGTLGMLGTAFSPCLSRKRLFQGSLGMLTTAFSPCLSRKKQLQGSRGRPKTAPFRTILDTSLSPLRLPFPLACRGKGCFRAPWECSRWPFPSACRGKGNFRLTREAQEQPFSDDSGCRL